MRFSKTGTRADSQAGAGSVVGLVAALVLIVATAGVTLWLTRDQEPQSSTVVSVEEIKAIAQLSTVEYHITEYYEESVERKILGLFTNTSTTGAVIVSAVVTGSVDFDKADIDIDETGDRPTVTIAFPDDSFVMKTSINPGDVIMRDVRDPIFIKDITAAEWTAMEDAALAAIERTARGKGIEQATAENAEKMLDAFLAGLGYDTEVTFEFLAR